MKYASVRSESIILFSLRIEDDVNGAKPRPREGQMVIRRNLGHSLSAACEKFFYAYQRKETAFWNFTMIGYSFLKRLLLKRYLRVLCTSGFILLATRLYERTYSMSPVLKWRPGNRSFGCHPLGTRESNKKWRLGWVGNWSKLHFTRLGITRPIKSGM